MSNDSFMNNIMQTQMVMLFTTLFSTTVSELIKFLGKQLGDFWSYIILKSKKSLNVITISKTHITDIKGYAKITNPQSVSYLKAILEFISKIEKYSTENDVEIVDDSLNHKTDRDVYLSKKAKLIPKASIKVDDFLISYKQTGSNKDKDGKLLETYTEETVVTISSTKSPTEIKKFLEKIHNDWIEKHYPNIPNIEEKLYVYDQIETDKDAPKFRKYQIPRDCESLDNIYFDEKNELDRILCLFGRNKIQRLGILMSGEPGGGKTTLARAIAVKFNMQVISLNLNVIKSDSQLKEIVQCQSILCSDEGYDSWVRIPLEKRLYLLDDIDCGTDLLLSRDLKSKNKKNNKMDYTTNPFFFTKEKLAKAEKETLSMGMGFTSSLTLKGILEVLDGITPMRGILIINTNRPNDIDSAVKRPGRIDLHLVLGKMSGSNANKLIKQHGFNVNIDIPDNLLMGCIVKNICTFAKDENDLVHKLEKEIDIQRKKELNILEKPAFS